MPSTLGQKLEKNLICRPLSVRKYEKRLQTQITSIGDVILLHHQYTHPRVFGQHKGDEEIVIDEYRSRESSSSLPDAQSKPTASTRIPWLKQAVADEDRSHRLPNMVGGDAGGVP